MSDELPPDVRATLAQMLEAAAEEARTRDADSVRARLDSVETVVSEEVPPGSGRERLRHGVRQVRTTVENEPLVAAEFLAAMRRLVEDGDGDDAEKATEDDGEGGDGNGDANPGGGRDADQD